jgi:hypothetical protein
MFNIFGVDNPPHGYLDKYSIKETVEDKTTLPIQPANSASSGASIGA